MRHLLFLTLFAAACTDVPSSGLHYDSVRDRLSDRPAWLFVHDEASDGTITARRWSGEHWIADTATLAIEHGNLRTAIDDHGRLEIDQLELEVAPFMLTGMFDTPAELQNVVLRLVEPVRAEPAWTSPDDAAVTLPMVFDVGLALSLDGGRPVPMVTQRPPAQSVRVVLTGDGDHIEASIDFDATGELWNCGDRVHITNVALSLTAATAD